MIEETKQTIRSEGLAIKLYDMWIRQRQHRPPLIIPEKGKEGLKELSLKNFVSQLAQPRRTSLEQLRGVAKEMSPADKVALLVMLELPTLEASALLQKLSGQLMMDPDAVYFSKINQSDNCGCGCGCGCAAMSDLPWEQQIKAHLETKPFSIDPFNEIGIPEKERDELLIRDFLASYERLSHTITEKVNSRYYRLGHEFGT